MKSRCFIILVFYCSFNLEVMVKFQLRKKKKKFTAYLSLVTKVLGFCCQVFSQLPFIYDGDLRQEHKFFIAACENEKRTEKLPIFPN